MSTMKTLQATQTTAPHPVVSTINSTPIEPITPSCPLISPQTFTISKGQTISRAVGCRMGRSQGILVTCTTTAWMRELTTQVTLCTTQLGREVKSILNHLITWVKLTNRPPSQSRKLRHVTQDHSKTINILRAP